MRVMSFKHEFGLYVCDGDQITCLVDGFTCLAWTDKGPAGTTAYIIKAETMEHARALVAANKKAQEGA